MQLVFFEGIAGSGKTTTAVNIGDWLTAKNIPNRVLKEMDEDNPFVIQSAITDGDEYLRNSINEWDRFVANRINEFPTWLFDGALLQCTTNALVFLDYPRDRIKEHILAICEKLKPYSPKLIYFHGNDVQTEVKRVVDSRGDEWINRNKEGFAKSPFGQRYTTDPMQGFYDFFEEIVRFNNEMLDLLPFDTLKINKSGLDWKSYEKDVIDFERR